MTRRIPWPPTTTGRDAVGAGALAAVLVATLLDDVDLGAWTPQAADLVGLARTANRGTRARRRPVARAAVRPSLQHLVDAMTTGAAVLGNLRGEIVASNALARALYDPVHRSQPEPVGYPRYIFLDPGSREFYPDWEDIADSSVASLRTVAGRSPFDKGVTDLVGELSTRSEEFRVRWAKHDVRLHIEGVKRVRHPAVGLLELEYNVLDLPADDGLGLTVYTAVPGSGSDDKLRLLASWWASEQASAAEVLGGTAPADRENGA